MSNLQGIENEDILIHSKKCYMSVSINTATVHYFGSRAELCLHIAAYGHCERVVHSVLLLKFIEHCNHPCFFPLCAVLEESLLVSKAVMCRRI